jgi:hypothetical protein
MPSRAPGPPSHRFPKGQACWAVGPLSPRPLPVPWYVLGHLVEKGCAFVLVVSRWLQAVDPKAVGDAFLKTYFDLHAAGSAEAVSNLYVRVGGCCQPLCSHPGSSCGDGCALLHRRCVCFVGVCVQG